MKEVGASQANVMAGYLGLVRAGLCDRVCIVIDTCCGAGCNSKGSMERRISRHSPTNICFLDRAIIK